VVELVGRFGERAVLGWIERGLPPDLAGVGNLGR